MADQLRTLMDLTLTRRELVNIAAFLDDETDSDDDSVRLLVGDGHSGYGLYAAHPEYPEEGAIFVKALPVPDGVRVDDAGQQQGGADAGS